MANYSKSKQELLKELEILKQDYESLKTSLNNNGGKSDTTLLHGGGEINQFLINNMFKGYAYGKMLRGKGVPVDLLFLDVNPAFESLTGLKDIAGKRASEAIPWIEELPFYLFRKCAVIALTGKQDKCEVFLPSLSTWLSISIFFLRKLSKRICN